MNGNIDIIGSITTAIKRVLTTLGGIALVGIIVGCLFAPLFGPLIQSSMMRNSDRTFIPMSQIPDVHRQMIPIRIGLWIICILSWITIIYLNIGY